MSRINVSVIDTSTNTVVGTPIVVGDSPFLVAVAPDGKHAYVTNMISNNVSVIDTASDTVAATVPVGSNPVGVGILLPPPGVPYGGGHGRGGE
jgi:YVTN family beta-propeller protein